MPRDADYSNLVLLEGVLPLWPWTDTLSLGWVLMSLLQNSAFDDSDDQLSLNWRGIKDSSLLWLEGLFI